MSISSTLPTIFSILLITLRISEAIKNGRLAKNGEFKYFVALIGLDQNCGGGILNENYIITAAHCVYREKKRDLIVVGGEVDIGSKTAIIRGVSEIHIHPKFSPPMTSNFLRWFVYCVFRDLRRQEDFNYDIAVLKLDSPLKLIGNVAKLDLPGPDTPLPYCTTEKFAGWGDIDSVGTSNAHLYWMNSILLYPMICTLRGIPHTSNHFCAEDPDNYANVMPGDSGSPWVHNNIIFGVLSIGTCDTNHPALFNNVVRQLDFIKTAMGET